MHEIISNITTPIMRSIFGGLKLFEDHAWLQSEAPANLNLAPLERSAYMRDNAQSIRNRAGNNAPIGTSGTVGVVGTPVSRSHLTIEQESDASSLATSGDGTENDPYIIDLIEINDPNNVFSIEFDDTDADYFVEFHNCVFADANFYTIWIKAWGSTPIKFVNCDIWSDVDGGSGYLARHEASNLIAFVNCHIKGMADQRMFGLIGAGSSLEIDNCLFDETEQTMSTDTSIVQIIGSSIDSVTVKNCTFLAGATTGELIIRNGTDSFNTLVFENNDITGFESIIQNNHSNTPELSNVIIRNNKIVDARRECISYANATDWIVEYNDFQHNTTGAGYRLVYFAGNSSTSGQDINGVTAQYNKFTKKTGSGAGNECLQYEICKNCVMQYNWITECSEDGYELVNSISSNIIANNVADNCTGQAVDCFFQWNETDWESYVDTTGAPDSLTYVHNMYGDSGDYGVVCQGIVGFYGHDIYVETGTTFGTVRIRDDGTQTDRISRKVRFAGPFALDANTGSDGQFSIQPLDTIDVEGRYIDENGDLQTVTTP